MDRTSPNNNNLITGYYAVNMCTAYRSLTIDV